MAEKTLNTRICLKYDTLANWTSHNPVLKKGELGIVEVPTGSTEVTQPPAILFKVGDGTKTWSQLPYASAKAADVYAWAKKTGIEVNDTGSGNVVSDIAWDATNNRLNVTRINVITDHQAIKSLNTTATTAQSTSASEAIAGSGTITLHKIAKTGTYSDLIDAPSYDKTTGTIAVSKVDAGTLSVGTDNDDKAILTHDSLVLDGSASSTKTYVAADEFRGSIKPGGQASQYIDGTGALKTFPTLPTVNNGKLSVTVNGTEKASFTANQASGSTVAFATGSANGAISVAGTDVAVKGLGSAAYTDSSAYDVAGAAADAKTEAIAAAKDYTDGEIDTEVTNRNTAITNAINALDKADSAVAGKYVSAVSEANGVITVTRADLPAATVTGVKSGEKVIGLDGTLLTSTLAISYDSSTRKVQLKGISGALVSEFDASAFVKDGMLWGEKAFVATGTSQEVSITKGSITQKHTFTNLTAGNQYLAFCFTDGAASPAYSWDIVDLQDLTDVYTAGPGLETPSDDDHKFQVKIDPASEDYISVSSAGVKISGVDAIEGRVDVLEAKPGLEKVGTVTSVAASGSDGISVTGSPITSSGTLTIKHTNSVTAKTTAAFDKVKYDAQGHITGSTAVAKADITALGIPGQDTTYTFGNGSGDRNFTVTPAGGSAQTVTVGHDNAKLDVEGYNSASISWGNSEQVLTVYKADLVIDGSNERGSLVFKDAAGSTSLDRDDAKKLAGFAVTSTSVTDGTTTFNKYVHPNTAGNKHIPTGGEAGQILEYSAAGTAKWATHNGIDKVGTVTSVGADTGLKITGIATATPCVAFDTDVTFVFNCGSSSTVI